MSILATVCGYIVCVFLAALAGTILWLIWTERINLSTLLTEANGQASMSRLQLLIFTFVVAMSFFMLVETNPKTLPNIPEGVLTLLGISASTYAVGKAISYSRDEGVTTSTERQARLSAVTKLGPAAQVAAVKEDEQRI
jgi:hypothetical protein